MFLKADFTWIIALCTFVPIFILAIVAVIIRIVKTAKLAKQYKKGSNNEELKNILLEAFGKNNIENVEVEMSRLTVTVKDIDLVNPDILKENGANGVLLMGNKVKCSFGDKAEEVCKLLQ